MWNIGAAEMITGCSTGAAPGDARPPCRSAPRRAPLSIDASRKWMLLRCDSITPLGRPVVPLVNRMTNGSSSSIVTSGNGASGACCSSAAKSRSNSTTGRRSGSAIAVEPLEAAPVAEEHLRLGELDRVRDLLARPPAVEPDGDRAERGRRPEHERVLDGVRRDDRDTVARADPVAVAQRGRDRRDRLEDRRERVLAVGEDHVRPVAQALGRAVEEFDERLRPVREHEHRRAEHGLLAQLERRAGTGERGEDGFGNGLRRPDQRGHAGRRCESSTPLSRMTSFESSGVKPKFSRSLM